MMALHAVMVQLQQLEILGYNICDQSQISCSSKTMGGTRYVSATDVNYVEKNTTLGQLPAELSDASSNSINPQENIDSKVPTRKKKNRGKSKQCRNFAKEVLPKDQCTFDEIQPCVWMKWSRVKPVENNTLYSFVNGELRGIPCLESNIHCGIRHGQDATQQLSTGKRSPVWKKKVKNPKNTIVSVETRDGNNDKSVSGKNGLHLQGANISINNSQTEAQKVQLTKGFRHHLANAQMVEHAFIASYRLQVASESLQHATGYPIAEFERLISSASPCISSPSFSCQLQDKCLDNEPCILSLSGDQIPNISLRSIWNWYEEPGNYGLNVIVDDAQKKKCCFPDMSSFHAHFVPLLSAVQLFGKEAKSKSSLSGDPISLSCLTASRMGNTLVDTVSSQAIIDHTSDVCVNDGKELQKVDEPALQGNADLIFEFFESEQPQRRMSFYNKIMELASGATNNQVFGDPSKLECTNLDDLHPASWFSVAWYPIYRIPEGKLNAAFLTYHSLGYMVQRCMKNDSMDKNIAGVVLPIIGLQSHNAQGELWFSPNSEVESSSFRELTSTLVKQRLCILEENALGFARGVVSKNNTTVTNRQPDYEFFVSRKH